MVSAPQYTASYNASVTPSLETRHSRFAQPRGVDSRPAPCLRCSAMPRDRLSRALERADPETLAARLDESLARGAWAEVFELVRRLAPHRPYDVRLLNLGARAAGRVTDRETPRRLEQAAAWLQHALELARGDVETLYQLGRMAYQRRLRDAAADYWRRAWTASPDDAEVREALLELWAEDGALPGWGAEALEQMLLARHHDGGWQLLLTHYQSSGRISAGGHRLLLRRFQQGDRTAAAVTLLARQLLGLDRFDATTCRSTSPRRNTRGVLGRAGAATLACGRTSGASALGTSRGPPPARPRRRSWSSEVGRRRWLPWPRRCPPCWSPPAPTPRSGLMLGWNARQWSTPLHASSPTVRRHRRALCRCCRRPWRRRRPTSSCSGRSPPCSDHRWRPRRSRSTGGCSRRSPAGWTTPRSWPRPSSRAGWPASTTSKSWSPTWSKGGGAAGAGPGGTGPPVGRGGARRRHCTVVA